jgi:hypothetical protein
MDLGQPTMTLPETAIPPTVTLTIPFDSLLQAVIALSLDEKQKLFEMLQREMLRRKIDEALNTTEPPVDGETYIQQTLQRFQQAIDDRTP